jgi:hypothetical protein
MVNKIGGKNYKKKKKSNSRGTKKNKLLENIKEPQDFLIAKIIERHNKNHFHVITLDNVPKRVYCSLQLSTCSAGEFMLYNQTDIFVLIFKPQPKLNKNVTTYQSIILATLTTDEVNELVTKYKFEFIIPKETDDDYIQFYNNKETDSSSEISNEEIIDIDDI